MIAPLLFGLLTILLLLMQSCSAVTEESSTALIMSHHKTGTFLTENILQLLRNNDRKVAQSDGLWEAGHAYDRYKSYQRIVHMIRNPFNTIVSGYYYHKKQRGSERWVYCVPANKAKCNLAVWEEKFLKVVYETFQEISDPWFEPEAEIYRRFLRDSLTNSKNTTALVQNGNLVFPSPDGQSYNSYLNKVSPIVGVIVEYLRANAVDMPRMARDTMYMQYLNNTVLGRNILLHDSVNANANQVDRHDQKRRKTYNYCLGNTFSMHPETGELLNNFDAIVEIINYLGYTVTNDMKDLIRKNFNVETRKEKTAADNKFITHSTIHNSDRLILAKKF